MQFCKVDTYIKMIHNPFREWNFRVNWINFKSHFLKLDTKKIVELIFQTFWPWENLARSYKFENCSCCDLCSNTSRKASNTHLMHQVLVLFIELHRIHEEFWKSRKSLWMSLKVSESLWNSQKVSESLLKVSESLLKVSESLWKSLKVSKSLLKVSESLLMNLTVMHSKRVLSLV